MLFRLVAGGGAAGLLAAHNRGTREVIELEKLLLTVLQIYREDGSYPADEILRGFVSVTAEAAVKALGSGIRSQQPAVMLAVGDASSFRSNRPQQYRRHRSA